MDQVVQRVPADREGDDVDKEELHMMCSGRA